MILNIYKERRKARKEQKAKELAERLAIQEAIKLELREISNSVLTCYSHTSEEIKEIHDAAQRLTRELDALTEEERYIE